MSQDDRTLLTEEFTSLQRKYETIREIKMRGYQIRSRAELTSGWEKPSKFFLNLEKKHFLSKTISELVDENDNKVTDSGEILRMQQKFYQDLFTSKKSIHLENSTYFSFLENLPRLSQAIKENLDLPLTLEELEIVIKQSKLNKAPGPDGYTNEFFKFFRAELQVWLFRAYQESFECGTLSPEITNGTITCIPKSGKLRNSLKNWRPLTLLNGSYKFLSSIIAERLKKVLELIVNSDQTGFIANRFIENTRLIFDTIIYTENDKYTRFTSHS